MNNKATEAAGLSYAGKVTTGVWISLLALLCAATAMAGTHMGERGNDEVRDAWLDGKLETAYLLNRHLSPFDIDTEIVDSVATISGTVESDIDKDLAEEIAVSIEGITKVNNKLVVDPDRSSQASRNDSNERTFGQTVDDATITAVVKSKLLANSNTSGLSVNVDTHMRIVTLTGKVETKEEKSLVEQIARNASNVEKVDSKLTVSAQG